MTTARRTVLGAVGIAGIAVAVGVVVGVAPASVAGAASGLDATLATGVLGAALVGYAFRRRRATPTTGEQRLATVNAAAEPDDPGQPIDDSLDWIVDRGNAAASRDARSQVRAVVRERAIRAHASAHGVSESRAADAVDGGAWTDDRVAAAFVGDERAPHYPLRDRLRGWVRPGRAFRRRADRAADTVHELATDAAASSAAPSSLSDPREGWQ